MGFEVCDRLGASGSYCVPGVVCGWLWAIGGLQVSGLWVGFGYCCVRY